ncbi:low temperature requirement protein A [Lentzea tibetensis]|uniref:Low temperature requirement protein A n=1 Tax=Lentzea tibetensis TaxID=2591470 RepID=A0A563EYE3_9PSEU|nr:low temperature requirement protein A [Lentzea tibetensis]TWP52689.1 low temperature requirement protein A [Lentzea tibetensis]
MSEETSEQRVIWSELFIDLIWVFAIAQLASLLAAGQGLALLLLVPVWWGWVGVTVYSNAAGQKIDIVGGRLTLFGVAAAGLGVAVAIPQAYDGRGLMFGLAYLALRLVLWLAMRPLHFYGGAKLDPFTVGLFLAAPLFVLGGLLPDGWRVAVWTLAALVEIGSPALMRGATGTLTFETAHLPERFGLFIIIAIGETVVALGTQLSAGDVTAGALGLMALAFVMICALWWTYFHFGASAMHHSLRTTKLQGRIVRQVFAYAHLAYVVGILCIAVGLKKLVLHPLDAPHSMPELLLAPGVAIFLAGFAYSRWRMFGAPTLFRSAGVVACALLGLAAPLLPLVVTAVLCTVVLIALNGLEYFWVTTERPLLLVWKPA